MRRTCSDESSGEEPVESAIAMAASDSEIDRWMVRRSCAAHSTIGGNGSLFVRCPQPDCEGSSNDSGAERQFPDVAGRNIDSLPALRRPPCNSLTCSVTGLLCGPHVWTQLR